MSPVGESKNNGENILCKVTKSMTEVLKMLILLNWKVGVLN